MTEAEWLASDDVPAMLQHVAPHASERRNRLYLVAGCYRIAHLFYDPANSLRAVEVGEKWADGRDDPGEAGSAAWHAECPTFGCDFEAEWVLNDLPADYRPDLIRRLMGKNLLSEADLLRGEWRVNETVQRRLIGAANMALDCLDSVPFERPWYLDRMTELDWPGRWLVDCVYGDPFRPATPNDAWLTPTAVGVARAIYDNKMFHDLPILADALEDAGCDAADLLSHCRVGGDHARGCWAVDLVLGLG